MKLKRHRNFFCCLSGSLLCLLVPSGHSQERVPPISPVQAEPVFVDSDGDQIPDAEDPHPLIPDAPLFSWWISDVTVGWDIDQTQVEKIESLSGDETTTQRKSSFTICGGIGLGGGYTQGISSDPASALLSLLPGAHLLKYPGDGFKAQSQLAASFDFKKSRERSETIKEIRSEFQKLEKQRAIKNRHIEFTVEFFNATNEGYKFQDFSIPVQTTSRQTRAEAMCYVGGEMKREFDVPANRPSGYPVRFRAMLSTTQSEQILDALEKGELAIAIERSNGTAINQTSGSDEIARRQQIASNISRFTSSMEFSAGDHSTRWQVARHNPATGKPTTIREGIAAINQIATSTGDSNYIELSADLLYAVGSFRNSPRNAFEVANARLAPLKVIGWTRMNRYGPVSHGQWLHELDSPLGDGVSFSLLPFEIQREELSSQIQRTDPRLSSEWLALCDFWLNYDDKKAFPLYRLSHTAYPLGLFFNSLTPDFAHANFEQMVSKWMKSDTENEAQAANDENARSIDNCRFREQVRLHRKDILDAASAGYSEAGALLTRIPAEERDVMETAAIRSALEMGNTDVAAVEAVTQLIHDLNNGKKVNLDKVEVPEHIFSRNMLGFLHFARCNKGLTPGTANDACHLALTYSADLGNSFAQAMKGWLLVNNARYKRSKLINRPDWPQDRDLGMALLEKSAKESNIARYILGKAYFANSLNIDRDPERARRFLKLAAQQNFGNARQGFQERFP